MAKTVGIEAVETNLRQFIGVDHEYVMTETEGELLDGQALSFMVKRRLSDADAEALVTVTGGAIAIAGAVVTVTVSAAQTVALSAGQYYWEIKRTNTGAKNVMGFGAFTLKRGVHRDT